MSIARLGAGFSPNAVRLTVLHRCSRHFNPNMPRNTILAVMITDRNELTPGASNIGPYKRLNRRKRGTIGFNNYSVYTISTLIPVKLPASLALPPLCIIFVIVGRKIIMQIALAPENSTVSGQLSPGG